MLNNAKYDRFWVRRGGNWAKSFGQENVKQYLCAPIIIKVIARFGDVLWNLAVPLGVAWAIN